MGALRDVGVNNIGAIVGERVFDRFRSLRAVYVLTPAGQ